MRLIKSRNQSVILRPTEACRKYFLVISVLHGFDFNRPGLISEQDLWKHASEEIGKETPLDLGLPKPCGEVLVSGKCFSPSGKPITGCEVRIHIGPVNKALYVFGNRYWLGKTLSDVVGPEPFTEMDIFWKNSFGGPDFPQNPTGRGIEHVMTRKGNSLQPLPNVEDPGNLVKSPNDRPDPAGFGPLDIAWPQRMSKAGTYDDHWLKEIFPGPAADLDPAMYLAACPDQWIQGYWNGDESFELHRLHSSKPVIQSVLPGFRPRIFLNRNSGDGENFQELNSQIDTIWLLPNAEKGILIHRSLVPIATDDGEDVLQVMTGYEKLGEEPKPLEHFLAEFEKRTDPKRRHLHLMRERGLIPDEEVERLAVSEKNAGQITGGEGKLEANLSRIGAREQEKQKETLLAEFKDLIEAAGLDPEKLFPPPPEPEPEPDPMTIEPETVDRMIQEAKDMAEARKAEAMEQFKQICAEMNVDAEAALRPPPEGLPRVSIRAALDDLKALAEAAGQDFSAMTRALEETEPKIHMAYRMSAHELPLPRAGPEENLIALNERLDTDRNLSGLDLARLDLAGRNLSGADLTEAFLEGANLSGADLSGAVLTGAVLAKADLTGACLVKAVFKDANLGEADLTKADLSGADLSGSVLIRADFSEAVLSGVRFTRAFLGQISFSKAVFSKTDLSEVVFYENDLSGVDFSQAILDKTVFLQTDLNNADFSSVRGQGAVFVGVSAFSADFRKADLKNARFVNQSRMAGADFSEARLEMANFMEADLNEVKFVRSLLTQANFMKAVLLQADFTQASARQANFMKADLRQAKLVGADLMEANLMKAHLGEADFRGASLFGAEVMHARFDQTPLDQANLKMTKLAKWSPS